VASLFNHSCRPNANHIFIDSQIVFTASRTIKQGEEICISYKPQAKSSVHRERKEWLERNFPFECRCEACLEDDECMPYLRCPSCSGNLIPNQYKISVNDCLGCGRRDQDITTLLENKALLEKYLDEGITCHNNERLDEAEDLLLKAETLSLQVFQETCPLLIKIKVALSFVYKFLEDYELAISYRRVALELEKNSSGENSCQVLEHLVHLNLLFSAKREKDDKRRPHRKVKSKEGLEFLEHTKQLLAKIEAMEFKAISPQALQAYSMTSEAFS
jgi:tetratricopeptide (TPR) repeat protein